MTDRAAGNALFVKGQYAEAFEIYKNLTTDAAALSNASEALLQLGRFRDAQHYAEDALELDPANSKSRSRMARAVASQGSPVAGHLMLAAVKNETERAAAHQRVAECEGSPTLALGSVMVRLVGEEQVGLVACQDIAPGEVVLREKRLAQYTREAVVTEDERAERLIEFLDSTKGPALIRAVQGIHPRVGTLTGMLERAKKLARPDLDEDELESFAHVMSVLFFSSFEMGVFAVASLFNHSCDPNCDSSVVDEENGVLEWRTNRVVQQGQELTISYLDFAALCLPVQVRSAVFARNWGGTPCGCERCAAELENGAAKNVTSKDYEDFVAGFTKYIEHVPYQFTNEKIEQLIRGKADFAWKGPLWQELIIGNWYANHCVSFMRQSRMELKRSLNFGGPLGRALDRVLDYYALTQQVVPEQSTLLQSVRDILTSMLKMALEIDNVVSQKLKNKDAIAKQLAEIEVFAPKKKKSETL